MLLEKKIAEGSKGILPRILFFIIFCDCFVLACLFRNYEVRDILSSLCIRFSASACYDSLRSFCFKIHAQEQKRTKESSVWLILGRMRGFEIIRKKFKGSVFTFSKHKNSSNIKIFKYRAHLIFRTRFPPLNRRYKGIGLDVIKPKPRSLL